VLRSLGLALGSPLFPLRKRLLHQFVDWASDAGGERGKVGFLIGREMNFHLIQGSIDRWRVKEGRPSAKRRDRLPAPRFTLGERREHFCSDFAGGHPAMLSDY
jgi:hypothetical protein